MTSLNEFAMALIDSGSEGSERFHNAYDQFLWMLATSSRDELQAFAPRLFADPYLKLPIPLQVVLFRLLGLKTRGDKAQVELAVSGIYMYCGTRPL